tara:strand:- start:1658 stop:2221 length:564 start_codon:yes stop_codon:yes gene_type:complete
MEVDFREFDVDTDIIHKFDIHRDDRGHFFEISNPRIVEFFLKNNIQFTQINVSKSTKKNTFRGFHFQKKPYEQSKFIKVLNGSIIDIIIDLRKESKNFLDHAKINLSDSDDLGVFIPKGFAHGFLTTADKTVVQYFVDEVYNQSADSGIKFSDKKIGIQLNLESKLIISKKDMNLPSFEDLINTGDL